jgi:hypothetical protein
MAKVVNVEQTKRALELAMRGTLTSNSTLHGIAKFARDRIYQFTKRGQSLAADDRPTKLKDLSPGYKNYRKRYQEWAKVGDFFDPNRSNLTLTGQLLNALIYKVTPYMITIFIENSIRRPTEKIPKKAWVKGRSTKKFRDTKPAETLTNAQVAKRVADKGRPFLGLDLTGRNRVRLMIVQELRRALKQSGFKK